MTGLLLFARSRMLYQHGSMRRSAPEIINMVVTGCGCGSACVRRFTHVHTHQLDERHSHFVLLSLSNHFWVLSGCAGPDRNLALLLAPLRLDGELLCARHTRNIRRAMAHYQEICPRTLSQSKNTASTGHLPQLQSSRPSNLNFRPGKYNPRCRAPAET